MREAVVVDPDALALEVWDDKSKGAVSWKTLISADRTDTADLVCGLAYFGPGERLARHSHVQPEIVHVVRGYGKAAFERQETPLTEGTTLYIPSSLKHEFVAGSEGMVLFYTFPAASFSEIEYQFEDVA